MAAWKCKMCGGTLDVSENGSVATCEYCGTKQTIPKLDDERRTLLLDRAGQFLRNNEYDRAAAIYEQAITEGGDDPELYWSLVLCRYGIEYVEDPATRRRIPTVNRTQYLAVSADPDYREAIARSDDAQRELYEREAQEIDAIQRRILEISQKEEPFDVFICYKESDANGRRTPDSVLAQELYYGLNNEGFKVFFSRISLEDKLGTAYEPYIFSALHSAKVMVVIGTKPEYFNAVWVKNEWSRYLALIKQGEKKVLIPAYRDMDPYDLPDEFAALQAQDMGKLGFMQDLLRGIKKIVGASASRAEKAPYSARSSDAAPSVDAFSKDNLIERGYLSLEDGEWNKADDLFEQALNLDLHEARAYVGKMLAERKLPSTAALAKSNEPFDNDKNYEKAIRFASDEYRNEIRAIADKVRENVCQLKYGQADAISLDSVQDCYQAADLFRSLGNYRDAADRALNCDRKRDELIDLMEEEARKRSETTRLLHVYSLAALFISLLIMILTRNSFLILMLALVVSGIVICSVKKRKDLVLFVTGVPPLVLFVFLIGTFLTVYIAFQIVFALCLFAFYAYVCFRRFKYSAFSLTIPEGTQTIPTGKYSNQLFSIITIPASVKSILDYAFFNCPNLFLIYFRGTRNDWKKVKKGTGWIGGTNSFLVICTDGQITYNKKQD